MRSHLCICLVMTLSSACAAAEPWADPRLKTSDGLELWLDARRAGAAGAGPDREAVEVWHDASGHHRDAIQPAAARRPEFWSHLGKSSAAIRFDGQADGLTVLNGPGPLHDFTLVIVAAPSSNLGGFRGLFSANQPGKNDYVTGLNVDLGGNPQEQWDGVNAEGAGFSGQKMLAAGPFSFGTFHTLVVSSAQSSGVVRTFLDGRLLGERPRASSDIRADEIRIGMRCYDNTGALAVDASYFDGCVAEVLLYSRALNDEQRGQVEGYLREKHAALFALTGLPPAPPVQMLVPGFAVRELPVKLTNVNCLAYGPDGLLYALGYDGRIHVLRDTNGDGLEDEAKVWWDKPTLRTPIAMAWRPEGVYVVSSGKISLLRDSTGSGRADTEEVIVTDWEKDDGHTGGNVDALGIAFDSENNLYFGLGCADYSNPYRVSDGKPHYNIRSQRGTILKVSPDRKRREIVCTGIRFPYALAFNRAGDLFGTDQEGETWCPGGNPLDELNYIIPGRHYGFPPRNPQLLPDVRDEPPVIGFGPQHQSTCGLLFNEPSKDRPLFGPKLWDGNAIVAGFSRGKLWRATLAKTPTGYVGRETLIACLRMLTLSPAISPRGDLVVACHGGLPDWGSGPKGEGKIYQIRYADDRAPQPVLAWAQSPVEVRVAFDRPIDPQWIDTQQIAITYGQFVRAGDRFESFRPGYAAVEQQSHAFRGQLRVIGATLSDDRRTLRVTTDPHPMQAWYAIRLPLRADPRADGQEPVIELAYQLSGVLAQWTPQGASSPEWSGWLPHLDSEVSRVFTAGSSEHDALREILGRNGTLELTTTLRTNSHELTIRAQGRGGIKLQSAGSHASTSGGTAVLTFSNRSGPIDLHVTAQTGQAPLDLHLSYHTSDDPIERPLPLEWQYPAWAPKRLPEPPPAEANGDLAGGDASRGESLFFSAEANCSVCHTVRGKGGRIGPDLSNLIHRDRASVLRDIVNPNAAINPDHIAYTLVLKDKRVLSGLVRTEDAQTLRVIDTRATETVVKREDVARMEASSISIMPEGYAQLGQAKLKDLVAFLTLAAPAGAETIAPPPLRTKAEVEAVLGWVSQPPQQQKSRPIRMVLVAGPKDHGPGEHDYPQWQKRWEPLLSKAPEVKVTTAFGRPDQKTWDQADLMVFYCWGPQFWDDASYKLLDAFLARGGGLVVLHSGVISEKEPQKLADRIGFGWISQGAGFRHGAHDLNFAKTDNPITRGFTKLHVVDEDYWPIMAKADGTEVLATTPDAGGDWPMLWTRRAGKGRVFCTILGHYLWTFDDPLSRALILRGMAWAAGESTGRWESLAMDGVKLADQ